MDKQCRIITLQTDGNVERTRRRGAQRKTRAKDITDWAGLDYSKCIRLAMWFSGFSLVIDDKGDSWSPTSMKKMARDDDDPSNIITRCNATNRWNYTVQSYSHGELQNAIFWSVRSVVAPHRKMN